jgi:protease I
MLHNVHELSSVDALFTPKAKTMSKKILIFTGNDFEDLELTYPRLRMIEAGFEVVLGAQEKDKTYTSKHGYPVKSDAALDDLDEADFAGLIVPGGWMPDKLRRDPKVLSLTKAFAANDKPIASICHGPWIDISAGIVRGVKYTSTPGIKDDLTNAGAIWSDAPVVVDGSRVSSRKPDDLPEFCKAFLKLLGK